jgi:hypothetical protein
MLEHGFGESAEGDEAEGRHSGSAGITLAFRPSAPPSTMGDEGKSLQVEGGACRDRTGDLRLAKPALSQLS